MQKGLAALNETAELRAPLMGIVEGDPAHAQLVADFSVLVLDDIMAKLSAYFLARTGWEFDLRSVQLKAGISGSLRSRLASYRSQSVVDGRGGSRWRPGAVAWKASADHNEDSALRRH